MERHLATGKLGNHKHDWDDPRDADVDRIGAVAPSAGWHGMPVAPAARVLLAALVLALVFIGAGSAQELTDHVHVRGGLHDGAAMGQETDFVVTPDDRLRCTFSFNLQWFPGEDAPNSEAFGPEKEREYDQIVPGLYRRMAAVAEMPMNKGAAPDGKHEGNFLVEVARGGERRWATLTIGEPEFDELTDVFADLPHGCWLFG